VIGTDRWRSEPPCVYPPAQAGHMAKRSVGVEYSPSILEPVRPGAVSPDRALCLPTFSHFVIVNKTSLSLSLTRQGVVLTDFSHILIVNEISRARARSLSLCLQISLALSLRVASLEETIIKAIQQLLKLGADP